MKTLKTVKGRKLTVGWKKEAKASGYQIHYSTDKNFKSTAPGAARSAAERSKNKTTVIV